MSLPWGFGLANVQLLSTGCSGNTCFHVEAPEEREIKSSSCNALFTGKMCMGTAGNNIQWTTEVFTKHIYYDTNFRSAIWLTAPLSLLWFLFWLEFCQFLLKKNLSGYVVSVSELSLEASDSATPCELEEIVKSQSVMCVACQFQNSTYLRNVGLYRGWGLNCVNFRVNSNKKLRWLIISSDCNSCVCDSGIHVYLFTMGSELEWQLVRLCHRVREIHVVWWYKKKTRQSKWLKIVAIDDEYQ